MDKPIERKQKNKRLPIVGTALITTLAIGYFAAQGSVASVNTYKVDRSTLQISTVSIGQFDEFLPLRGRVEPEETLFVDAIDGGRVEEVYVQEGTLVKENQPILRLSNTSLQLNVLAREAEVSEQINNMRNTRLALEQNQLQLKRDLIELDFEVLRLEKQQQRNTALVEKQLISQQRYEAVQDELAFQKTYRETVRDSQQKESALQEQQLKQLAQSIDTLESNLAISRASLDKLTIRAPRAGQLTFLDAKVGESKRDGERLGQLDIIQQFKISALVDEFYVNQVKVGQTATLRINQQLSQLTISKIYPGIEQGSFKVDFAIEERSLLSSMRLGQTLQIELKLSSSSNTLQIANGGFLQNTAGNWAFVVSADQSEATKRNITLGRKTPKGLEVLSGLNEGELIITSSYSSYETAEQLQLTN